MDEIKLTRTGKPPLAFTGEPVAESSSKQHNGPLQNRWHEVAIYRTESGRFVASVTFRSIWQGEHANYTAEHAATPAELVAVLSEYDPLDGWEGYPDNPHFAERQARTQAAISDGYKRALSSVFADIDGTEERIP